MNYDRKTLTDKIVLDLFNNASNPLYYMGKTKDNKKNYLVFECKNPFSKQLVIKNNFAQVETRAYYPHQLYVRTR